MTLAVSYRVDPSDEVADELFERARENVRSTATGVMWGSLAPCSPPARCSTLLGGSDLLGENTLAPEAAAVLRRTAMHDEGLANWPSSAGERPRQDDASPRLLADCLETRARYPILETW